jgi:hypothetical protein
MRRQRAAACGVTGASRRAVLLGPLLLAVGSGPASATYALSQAHEKGQTWKATDKALERAVFADIDEKLDQKRRFRPEVGELGYVGGNYTKKSAAPPDEFAPVHQALVSGDTSAVKPSKLTYVDFADVSSVVDPWK